MANPLKYVKVPKARNKAKYIQPTYTSRYGDRLDTAIEGVTNFQYDPMKDASYQALAKVYGKRGEAAAKNTIADASMLNGGLSTSYAASAAQQMRNDYNAELASLIPDLEERAFNRSVQSLAALGDAEDRDYGRYRDLVGDTQWKYTQDYQKYRDRVSDQQWARNFNLDVYGLKKKNSGGGRGGGGGGRGGGGGGYYGGGSGSGSGNPYLDAADTARQQHNQLTRQENRWKAKYGK